MSLLYFLQIITYLVRGLIGSAGIKSVFSVTLSVYKPLQGYIYKVGTSGYCSNTVALFMRTCRLIVYNLPLE